MKLIINILIGGVVVIAMFFGIRYFINREPEVVPSVQVVGGTAVSSNHNDYITLLSAVNGINFDQTIFNDPLFQRLESFRQDLPQRSSGRQDPFAPIGGRGAGPAATTTRGL